MSNLDAVPSIKSGLETISEGLFHSTPSFRPIFVG